MDKLVGYRTIISIFVSFILKILVFKGVFNMEAGKIDATADLATNAIMLTISGVADLCGIYFRMKATKSGALAKPTNDSDSKPPNDDPPPPSVGGLTNKLISGTT